MAANLADIQRIQQHLEMDGADAENILSDLNELAERDPTLFTGELGERAHEYLEGAKDQIAAGDKREVFGLYMALNLLEQKLEDLHVPGGKRRRKTKKSRRGRKSRRKSLRQRK